MWRMLQHDEPGDYVLATGAAYSVRDFLRFAFEHVGLQWQDYVKFDDRYTRPSEVDALIGDYAHAQEVLGWSPTILAPRLAQIMVDADVEALALDGSYYVDSVQSA